MENNNGSMQTSLIPVPISTLYHEQPPVHNSSSLKPQPVPNVDQAPSTSQNVMSDDEYFKSLPPGFRFDPKDHELILHYLWRKLNQEPLPRTLIISDDVYRTDPQTLADEHGKYGGQEMYFFTPRDKKYKGGKRPRRTTGNGYWKATGADKIVKHGGQEIGYRKALVYHNGKPPNGRKTSWIMHEYRVKNPPAPMQPQNEMRLDDSVLCRIRKKPVKSNANQDRDNHHDADDDEEASAAQSFSTSSIHQQPPSDQETLSGIINESPTMDVSSTPQFNTGIHQNIPAMAYNNVYPHPLTVFSPIMDPMGRIHGPANHHQPMMNTCSHQCASMHVPMNEHVLLGQEQHRQNEEIIQVDRLTFDGQESYYFNMDMVHIEMDGKPGSIN